MFLFAEIADPGTTNSTLATLGVPGLVFLLILAFSIIVYQNRKIEQLYREKNDLQERRLNDKMETNDKYIQAMGESSRTMELLAAKLKSGK